MPNVGTIRIEKGESLVTVTDTYITLDLETTGLDPKYCDIIEIGCVKIKNGTEIEQFQSLINPEYEIDDFIIELTGITNEMLAISPTIEKVLPDFLSFVGNEIIVGHNVNFDINFIYDNCVALSLPPFKNDFIDTMRLSRRLFKDYPNHRLTTLVNKMQISNSIEHRALSDAIYTGQCYEYIKRYISDNNIDLISLYAKSQLSAKDITATTTEFDESHPIFGKLCVFTGTLEKMTRKEAMQLVVNLGGMCADGVNKKVNFLILGNNDFCTTIKDGKSTKQKKAEDIKLKGGDIEIISENVFYDMIAE